MDLGTETGELQVLFAEPLSADRWRNTLWTSPDGQRWEPVLSFGAVAPARSFARLGAYWYVGLGSLRLPSAGHCTDADLATGMLLRWPAL